MQTAVCRNHPDWEDDSTVLEMQVEEVISVFHSLLTECNIPKTNGYAICKVHHTFKPDTSPVEVPIGPKHQNVVHCLRHAETGFVEKFAYLDTATDSAVVPKLIGDLDKLSGKLLCCDENYTTMDLMDMCTGRNIPFLGRISNHTEFLQAIPDLMEKPAGQSFRVFFDESWIWACWDDPVHEPVILVSNFHMGHISDPGDCAILKLYNKTLYGSEQFDRFQNNYKFHPKHPMCTSGTYSIIYRVLNAITLNTKTIYEQEHDLEPTHLFNYLMKLLLCYATGCTPGQYEMENSEGFTAPELDPCHSNDNRLLDGTSSIDGNCHIDLATGDNGQMSTEVKSKLHFYRFCGFWLFSRVRQT